MRVEAARVILPYQIRDILPTQHAPLSLTARGTPDHEHRERGRHSKPNPTDMLEQACNYLQRVQQANAREEEMTPAALLA